MISKRGFSIMILLAVLLAACGARPTVKPTQAMIEPAAAVTSRPGCTVVGRKPVSAEPTQPSLLPPANEKDWSKGPAEASITIIEYSDFQCPHCAALASVLARLMKEYPEDLRVVFRHFPLNGHILSLQAAQAAEAAGLQGKFWEMHDLLFARQSELGELKAEEFPDWIVQRAIELGLEAERFKKDMNSNAIAKLVKEAQEYNASVGMIGTPYVLFNNDAYGGRLDYGSLKAIIDLKLLERKQFSDCPPMALDPGKQYFATLHTEKGDITIELYADKAPLAVNNFIFLAQHGWYDGVTFHRVIPGFVAQAGDPSGTGFGGPGYAFDNEIVPELTFNGPGIIGMANAGPGSNGSQFFITYTATPNLDGGYTIFARVIAGMDVAQKLTARDPSQGFDLPPGDKILSITIEVK